MKTPTMAEFKDWVKANEPLATAVVAAQAFAKSEKVRVDAYILPIFKKYTFKVNERYADKEGKTIDKPEDIFLCMDDPQVKAYFEETYDAHEANGWTGERGYSPELVADHNRIEYENGLIASLCKLLGNDERIFDMELRQKALDLALSSIEKVYAIAKKYSKAI